MSEYLLIRATVVVSILALLAASFFFGQPKGTDARWFRMNTMTGNVRYVCRDGLNVQQAGFGPPQAGAQPFISLPILAFSPPPEQAGVDSNGDGTIDHYTWNGVRPLEGSNVAQAPVTLSPILPPEEPIVLPSPPFTDDELWWFGEETIRWSRVLAPGDEVIITFDRLWEYDESLGELVRVPGIDGFFLVGEFPEPRVYVVEDCFLFPLNAESTADAHVVQTQATSNFGGSDELMVSKSPVVRTYLRFQTPTGLDRHLMSTTLRLYPLSDSDVGVDVYTIQDAPQNEWQEDQLTYAGSPRLDTLIASSGPLSSGKYVDIDLESLITAGGIVDLALATSSETPILISSREAGTETGPRLIVESDKPVAPTLYDVRAVSPRQVDLTWASTFDNEEVAGYTVFRNGVEIASIPANIVDRSGTLQYSDMYAAPGGVYHYTIDAFDVEGNHSAQNSPWQDDQHEVSMPDVFEFAASEGAEVTLSAPDSTSSPGAWSYDMRESASTPELDTVAFLKFPVSNSLGSGGQIQLGLYIDEINADDFDVGINVHAIDDNWSADSITYHSQPPLGELMGASGPLGEALGVDPASGQAWGSGEITIDLTTEFRGDGEYNFALTLDRPTSLIATTLGPYLRSIRIRSSELTPSPQLRVGVSGWSPPSTPVGLSAEAVNASQINLSWAAPERNQDGAGYMIYRDGLVIAAIAGDRQTFVDMTASPNTLYTYRVDAFDSDGFHSLPSESAVAIIDTNAPERPPELIATVANSTQVVLVWLPATDNVSVAGYTVYRDGITIATVPGDTLSYTDTDLTPDAVYSYTIDAFDAAGNHSEHSTPAIVRIAMALPPDPVARPFFDQTWARTDLPVTSGHAIRTWMWGPAPFTNLITESYAESPDGWRTVLYYDKARMEVTHPANDSSSIWYVTNGLLVVEMVTGQMQIGDASFTQLTPAHVNVAGDGDDPAGPTYQTFAGILDASPLPLTSLITQRIDRAGQVTDDPALASQDVRVSFIDDVTNHSIAEPFWGFMNSSGTVYEDGGYTTGSLFRNPFFATGRPITESYWAQVLVGGTSKLVLVQCFERRCLTFTPDNEPGWQVEAGNVGLHYYLWRYGNVTGNSLTADG